MTASPFGPSRYRYTQWSPLEGAGATMQELYDLQQDPYGIQQPGG